jgi:hypothetical protein
MLGIDEPIRRYVYGIATSLAAVGILYGFVTDTEVAAWLAVLNAVLTVPFVEAARAKVRPLTKDSHNGQTSAVQNDD